MTTTAKTVNNEEIEVEVEVILTKVAKITRATFKSFIKKNEGSLYINVKSSFDGMTDSCEPCNNGFVKAPKAEKVWDNNLGINGVWLVGSSRDSFQPYFANGFTGIEVYNCCGHFILAIKSI